MSTAYELRLVADHGIALTFADIGCGAVGEAEDFFFGRKRGFVENPPAGVFHDAAGIGKIIAKLLHHPLDL